MSRIFALFFALLLSTAAFAADNSVLVTPCASGCVTIRSKDVGTGIESLLQILGDTSGNALATAPGSGNTSFALPVQGVANGVAMPVTLQASATTAIGKVDPNTIATWGLTPIGGTTSAPTNAMLSGCQYLASAPTYTTGDAGALQCTINGSLHTTVDNATALGAAAAASSSPTVLPILVHTNSATVNAGYNAKNSAGQLAGFNCTAVAGGAAGLCIAYNSATLPSTGSLTASLILGVCSFDTTARGCSWTAPNGTEAYSAGLSMIVTTAATPLTYTSGTDTAWSETITNN